jgi:hypothetical protein
MSRSRWAGLGAALGVLAALALAIVLLSSSGGSHRPVTTPAPPPPAGEQFGVNVNRLFDDRTYDLAQVDLQLSALAATGATIARSDALWEVTEPTPPVGGAHRYDWRFDDAIAASLARHGLRWLPILDYSAAWARAHPALLHSPPRSPAEFAAFASAFARRYGAGGTFWQAHPDLSSLPVDVYEVWNEPDNGEFWQPVPNARAYADLYLAARDAIAGVDPSARVIVGGLVHPARFLTAMLRARPQLASRLDGVGVHPYGPNPRVVLARVRNARLALVSLGLPNVPLYLTEFGWTVHPPGSLDFAPEALRPRYISTSIAVLGHTNCGIAAVILYTWVTPETNPSNHEDWFGIHPPQGGSSPDTGAFAAGIRAARAAGAREPVCAPT